MHRAKRWLGYVVAVVLGAMTVDLAAQLLEFSDGTYGTKAVIYTLAGTEVDFSAIGLSATDSAHLAAIEVATEATQAAVETANTLKYYISAGASEDESQVKATAGVLVSVSAKNSHATTDAYLKCTNATAVSTTPGSTAVFYELLIPAGPSGNNDTDINAAFSTALTCYIVTGKAANDVAEVAATDVSYNLRYR
jgi:hypothetical protein